MVFTGKTAIVTNQVNFANNGYNGKVDVNYRWRNCDTNLTSNTPANQYQRLKHIQNTVGVYSCMYTMNLAGLSVYQKPKNVFQTIYVNGSSYIASPGVNWNQMSDRASPHKQIFATASGSTYHGSSLRRSIVRHRPGSLSPGGIGCDIKHNSYDRYLNRIKGKAPYRRGVIPPGFGLPIPFNCAYPVYGGKIVKTNIVSGCNCNSKEEENVLFKDNSYDLNNVYYKYSIGDKVFVIVNEKKEEAVILAINGNNYEVQLLNGTIINTSIYNILFYSNCDCKNSQENNLVTLENNYVLLEDQPVL